MSERGFATTEQIQHALDKARLWTTEDLLTRLPVTSMTITNWRNHKQFPAVVISGEERPSLRFVPKDVATWARANGYSVPGNIYRPTQWPKQIEQQRFQPQRIKKTKKAKYMKWTEEKLLYLINHVGTLTDQQMAERLGCTRDAVWGQRHRLELQDYKLRDPV
jgi:hypothetical protein